MSAASVTINLTRQTFLEVGKPTNSSQAFASVAKGPKEYSEHRFVDSFLNATSRSPSSFVLVPYLASTSLRLVRGDGMFSFSPAPRAGVDDALTEAEPRLVPSNATWGSERRGVIVASGNFSMNLWDTIVSVRNNTEHHTYFSGNWTQGIGPFTPNQPHAIRDRYEQWVRIDVQGAILELTSIGRGVSFAAAGFSVDGNVSAVFSNAHGSVEHAGRHASLAKTRWAMAGPMRLDLWHPVANGSFLQGHLVAPPQTLGMPTPTPGANERVDTLSSPRERFAWPVLASMIPFTLLLGVMGLLHYRLARPSTAGDVEMALSRREPLRAQRLARRLVASRPRDPNAIFLFGAALMLGGDHQKVIREIEPLAFGLADRERAGVAFVLALAANTLGQGTKTRRWANEAARDPVLRGQLVAERLWNSASETPQPGYV
jgi:hypothetical protein